MKPNAESLILYTNIFLLTLSIGININSLYIWLQAVPDREYCNA